MALIYTNSGNYNVFNCQYLKLRSTQRNLVHKIRLVAQKYLYKITSKSSVNAHAPTVVKSDD